MNLVSGVSLGAFLLAAFALATIAPVQTATGAQDNGEPPAEFWIERHKITPNDAGEDGMLSNPSHWGVHFGSEVVLDGGTALIGTQHNSNSDSSFDGKGDGLDWAYVFDRDDDGQWTQTDKLVPSDAQTGDSFGFSLDLDEEAGIIVVGNPAGQKIYIFEQTTKGTWEEIEIFEGNHLFGYDVAVSGGTIATVELDHTVFFERESEGWNRTGEIIDAVSPIDIVDDTFVGASMPNYRDMAVYEKQDGEWVHTAELPQPPASRSGDPIPGEAELDADRRTILVGAGTDSRVLGIPDGPIELAASGSVWIYERQAASWTMTAEISNPDPWRFDGFGHAIGLAGDRAVVGAEGDIHNGAKGAGAVYVVDKVDHEWKITSKLRNSDGPPWGGTDFFGESVDIHQETILAGAPWDDNRRDGTPPPLDDEADIPPCGQDIPLPRCDEGQYAGSAYIFEPATKLTAEVTG